jgi:DinB family protein
MDGTTLLVELYSRLPALAHHAVDGASLELLTTPPVAEANTIAWLVWHSARVLDDHVGDVMGTEQLWCEGIWPSRFDLPADGENTGYGHTVEQVRAVRPSAPEDLTGYFDEVHAHSIGWISKLGASDLDRIVDTRWDPPVTLAVRLVSVADDGLQHLGQAAYARGILER